MTLNDDTKVFIEAMVNKVVESNTANAKATEDLNKTLNTIYFGNPEGKGISEDTEQEVNKLDPNSLLYVLLSRSSLFDENGKFDSSDNTIAAMLRELVLRFDLSDKKAEAIQNAVLPDGVKKAALSLSDIETIERLSKANADSTNKHLSGKEKSNASDS